MIKIRIKKKPVGAAILIKNKNGEVLLLKRAPESHFAPNQWGYPGGKIEDGESSDEAARRETEEETTLVVSSITALGVFNEAVEAFYSDDFEGKVQIDFEHTDWKWVSPAEVANYDLAPSVWEIYEKVRDRDN
jgi:mutator protein MutT